MEKSYTYVMSDIHGEYDAFVKMLDKTKFNDKDKLYVIGDVLDRGPKPIKTLMHIMNSNNITMLAGNHEHIAILCLRVLIEDLTDEVFSKISDKFIESLEDWKMNGGGTTIKDLFDYSKEDRKKVLNFLMKLKLYKEKFSLSKKDLIAGTDIKECIVICKHLEKEMDLYEEFSSTIDICNKINIVN